MKSNKNKRRPNLHKTVSLQKDFDGSNCKLTLDELRKCAGFADVSDSEGEAIIESLYRLSLIAFNYQEKEEDKK